MPIYFNINYEFSSSSVLDGIGNCLKRGEAGYICVADGNVLQKVHKDLRYREVVNGAMFSICDSSWVPLYLKKLYSMQVYQYSGSQIFEDITKLGQYSQAFIGGSPQVLSSLRTNLSEVNPQMRHACFMELPFMRVEEFDYQAIADEINAASPDIIWVGLGAPKQEIFMSRLKQYLKRGVMIGVGAVFNFRSGISERRAPKWMIKMHLEFVYRALSNPRKQLPRVWNILTTLPSIIKEERSKV